MRALPIALPIALITLVAWLGLAAAQAAAQQVTAGAPVQRLGDGFFESFGVHWGLNWKNGFFRFGGPGAGVPPFGQGYRQSLVGQMPILTLTNGIPGFIADQSISPFVTGWTPVVGNNSIPPLDSEISSSGTGADAVRDALQRVRSGQPALPPAARPQKPAPPPAAAPPARASSAAQPAPSVAEARRLRAAEEAQSNADAQGWLDRGQEAEAAGKPGVARVCYQTAARRASGEVKQRATQRLEALATRPRPQ